jgi:ARG and Rhodanese-Phosphatase-superfamily-associated Protein domain
MKFAKGIFLGLVALLVVMPLTAQFNRTRPTRVQSGTDVEAFRDRWTVLEPITRRNLSVYPVISNLKVDTSDFLTLDEGLAAGLVRIAERGELKNAMVRPRDPRNWPPVLQERPQYEGASVNELMLVNESSRPLLLLAGEVVSGGKQNRIIGADLVVPPKSDPLPLSVFCVEHGRWSAGGAGFGAAGAIAHPEIRLQAQVNKSQSGVWNSVARSESLLQASSPTASYTDVLDSPQAKRDLDEAASSIESDYARELRKSVSGRGGVGVVVAINGRLVWSDIFPSAELFRKYWPKLLRSYVLEAESRGKGFVAAPSSKEARVFLLEANGRVMVNEQPGAYRRTEISSDAYQIVALEALGKMAGGDLLMHYNKMARDQCTAATGSFVVAPVD